MTHRKMLIGIAAAMILSIPQAFSFTSASERDSIVGEWRGSSTCVVKPSACKDEDAVYRFARIAERDNAYSLDAGKFVSGKVVSMGVVDCGYRPEQQRIDCALPNGARVELWLKADKMDGTMKLQDGTLWRNIKLAKGR